MYCTLYIVFLYVLAPPQAKYPGFARPQAGHALPGRVACTPCPAHGTTQPKHETSSANSLEELLGVFEAYIKCFGSFLFFTNVGLLCYMQ